MILGLCVQEEKILVGVKSIVKSPEGESNWLKKVKATGDLGTALCKEIWF